MKELEGIKGLFIFNFNDLFIGQFLGYSILIICYPRYSLLFCLKLFFFAREFANDYNSDRISISDNIYLK